MKRITIILKTSEVTAVRKAVFAAGGSRIVISPASSRNAVELRDGTAGCQFPCRMIRYDSM